MPYTVSNMEEAVAFVEKQRRRGRRETKGPRK